jgi:hypothetical protein
MRHFHLLGFCSNDWKHDFLNYELERIWKDVLGICGGINSWSRVLFEKLIVAHLARKFKTFMESEDSLVLPCSQEPATGPYPQSDESRPVP